MGVDGGPKEEYYIRNIRASDKKEKKFVAEFYALKCRRENFPGKDARQRFSAAGHLLTCIIPRNIPAFKSRVTVVKKTNKISTVPFASPRTVSPVVGGAADRPDALTMPTKRFSRRTLSDICYILVVASRDKSVFVYRPSPRAYGFCFSLPGPVIYTTRACRRHSSRRKRIGPRRRRRFERPWFTGGKSPFGRRGFANNMLFSLLLLLLLVYRVRRGRPRLDADDERNNYEKMNLGCLYVYYIRRETRIHDEYLLSRL